MGKIKEQVSQSVLTWLVTEVERERRSENERIQQQQLRRLLYRQMDRNDVQWLPAELKVITYEAV